MCTLAEYDERRSIYELKKGRCSPTEGRCRCPSAKAYRTMREQDAIRDKGWCYYQAFYGTAEDAVVSKT
jgi:hypothetical protein